MPRQRSEDEIRELRAQAAALRAAGVGAKRIAQQLEIPYNLAQTLLRGVPVPAALMRLRAKDDLREAAIALRREGRTYDEIKAELGVSKGSLSLWLRELAHPSDEQREAARSGTTAEPPLDVPPDAEIARALRSDGWLLREIAEELGVTPKTIHTWCRGIPTPPRAVHGSDPAVMRERLDTYWKEERERRAMAREIEVNGFSSLVGELTPRELELVAVACYMCEGTKSKPWRRQDRLSFINSDVGVIQVFLAWLRAHGVDNDRLRLRLSIHETADLAAAHEHWASVVGVPVAAFAKPVIKRHRPLTVRKNVGSAYHGCLVIDVRQSRTLYRRMLGVWRGTVQGSPGWVRQTGSGHIEM
jgi:transposase